MRRSRSDAAPPERQPGRTLTVEAGEEHFLFEAYEPFLRTVGRERMLPLAGRVRPEERGVRQMMERVSSPLQRILDLLPQAAAILDNHGAVLYANTALAQLCGVSPDAWGEMPLEWHLSDESRRRFRRLRQQMRNDGLPATLHVRMRGSNEPRFLSACVLTPVTDAGLFVLLDVVRVGEPRQGAASRPGLGLAAAPGAAAGDEAAAGSERTEVSTPELVPSETIAPGAASRRIAVFEEDETLRETLLRMLEQLGYQVVALPDAESCFALLGNGEPLDGLLFDPWRGGAAGAKCLERIVELRPELPLVAYCAQSDGMSEPLWAPGVQAVLSRPTSLTELYEAWQAVFEGRTSGSAWVAIPLKPFEAPSDILP
jgi:PAS domain-containing protein